jgi:hypothetical protein
MIKKEKIIDDLNWITEKISSLVWYINLGTLGTTWSSVIGTSKYDAFRITFFEARWIFILCLSALLCEMGQYISAYFDAAGVLNRMEAEKRQTAEFDPSSPYYIARKFFFGAKIVLTVVAAVLLLVLIFYKLGGM